MDGMDGKQLNTTSLAYRGDAVYEVYIRMYVIQKNAANVDMLHRRAVAFVRADAQASCMKRLMKEKDEKENLCKDDFHLTEEEAALVRRARNKKSASRPQNADPVLYKWATAFEALIGYLYLTKQEARLRQLVKTAVAQIEGKPIKDNF